MIRRFSSLIIVLAVLPGWTLSGRSAQNVSVTTAFDARTPPDPSSKLAFSDADHLYAIGNSRAILYVMGAMLIEQPAAADFDAMLVANVVNVQPETEVFSITSDGRTALLGVRVSGVNVHLVLLDTETGRIQEIPSRWYDLEYAGPNAALSRDGRFVSVYSESGPADQPMVVTVYDWATKTLVAKKTSEYISAGGAFGGGVTADGAIEFVNNRVGRKIVELKTGRLIAWFGADSVRSPDGAWVVEFPDLSFNESGTKDMIVRDGANGKIRGKLDVQVPDDETYGQMTGAFCGATGRFAAASGRDVAIYTIPSGKLLASFPAVSWRDASAGDTDHVSVACSPTGARVAILSGARLTFHDLR